MIDPRTATTTDICIDYILCSENDDFLENPSRNHVYYYALIATHGIEEAEAIYKEAEEAL